MINYKEELNRIKHFVFDIDGVLTNGEVEVREDGSLIRRMFIKDGYAMHHAISRGYSIAIISGGRGSNLVGRLNNLGIKDIYLNVQDKKQVLDEYIDKLNINKDDILYMGDDDPDICVKEGVRVFACPFDASIDVRQVSDYISPFKGGRGCVRDVIEQTMRSQDNWGDK